MQVRYPHTATIHRDNALQMVHPKLPHVFATFHSSFGWATWEGVPSGSNHKAQGSDLRRTDAYLDSIFRQMHLRPQSLQERLHDLLVHGDVIHAQDFHSRRLAGGV